MKRPIARAFVIFFAIALYVGGAVFTGCRQSEDERCQVQDDCEPELVCCVRDTTEATIIGGVCKPANRCELDLTDAGVDASNQDAGEDAQKDAGADAPPEDAAPKDSAPPDTKLDAAEPDTIADAPADVVRDVR